MGALPGGRFLVLLRGQGARGEQALVLVPGDSGVEGGDDEKHLGGGDERFKALGGDRVLDLRAWQKRGARKKGGKGW